MEFLCRENICSLTIFCVCGLALVIYNEIEDKCDYICERHVIRLLMTVTSDVKLVMSANVAV